MNAIIRTLFAVVFAATALFGCSGGSSSPPTTTTPTTPPPTLSSTAPFIAGAIINQQDSAGGQVYFAMISVASGSLNTLTPVSTADVKINNVALSLDPSDPTSGDYFAVIAPDAAGNFNLTVTVSGTTYTATDSAITGTFPVLSLPNPFTASAANAITWTAPSGAPANMGYQLEISSLSGSIRVPVAGTLTPGMPLPTSTSSSVSVPFDSGTLTAPSATIPAATLVAGTSYEPDLTIVWPSLVSITNAASGSVLVKASIVHAPIFTAR
jgi:hypothetical protein